MAFRCGALRFVGLFGRAEQRGDRRRRRCKTRLRRADRRAGGTVAVDPGGKSSERPSLFRRWLSERISFAPARLARQRCWGERPPAPNLQFRLPTCRWMPPSHSYLHVCKHPSSRRRRRCHPRMGRPNARNGAPARRLQSARRSHRMYASRPERARPLRGSSRRSHEPCLQSRCGLRMLQHGTVRVPSDVRR
jgi:hypothetical protein